MSNILPSNRFSIQGQGRYNNTFLPKEQDKAQAVPLI